MKTKNKKLICCICEKEQKDEDIIYNFYNDNSIICKRCAKELRSFQKKGIPVGAINCEFVGVKVSNNPKLKMTKNIQNKNWKTEFIIYGGDLKRKKHLHLIVTKKEGWKGIITNEDRRGTKEEHILLNKETFNEKRKIDFLHKPDLIHKAITTGFALF